MSGPPADVRDVLRRELWQEADRLDWVGLTDRNRSEMYERWAESPTVGGVLSRFMDARQVRVYIKDSLMKPYIRQRMEANELAVYRILALERGAAVERTYIKSHGKFLSDRRIFCWGSLRDWKLVLMSVYERSFTDRGDPFAVVFIDRAGSASSSWPMITEAAKRLGIARVEIVDGR
jgi:hypothetical protein